jgi:phosphoenolpyruvate-protein kinase (PTS system EI component)
MPERVLTGTAASPGIALGTAWRPIGATATERVLPPADRAAARSKALAALDEAARELSALASGLPQAEAHIVETGALIGRDPALVDSVERAIERDGLTAADAILAAADEYATAIAAVGDELLAARADDVRSLGRRAARLAGDGARDAPPGTDLILVAADLGPGDVAEVASSLAGVALAGGGPTAHAAIVARSLGIPMVTGLGVAVMEIAGGSALVVDGTAGAAVISPSVGRARIAAHDRRERLRAATRARELRDEPAVTTDGTRVTVLANVASREELALAIDAGAEGIGLLRTELAFLEAPGWPTVAEHAAALAPILEGLGELPAVIRVLDFGADKCPPFLRGTPQRGIGLLLANPDAYAAQLEALVRAARHHDVRILLPLVDRPEQVAQTRALLGRLSLQRSPVVGSMIETPRAAQQADAIAARSDFLSIGTNDLTAATLGADRFKPNGATALHPKVLRSIARSVDAAHGAGIAIEVCGEAASDPAMVPLLVGLGVDQLSVGAARVGAVRALIRRLNAAEASGLARSALTMDSAAEVASICAEHAAYAGAPR